MNFIREVWRDEKWFVIFCVGTILVLAIGMTILFIVNPQVCPAGQTLADAGGFIQSSGKGMTQYVPNYVCVKGS